MWSSILKKLCETHYLDMFEALEGGETVEGLITMKNSTEFCDEEDCDQKITRLVYGPGESGLIQLPTRKEYILQMFKELQIAIETGCVIEFSAEEKFMPQLPIFTIYKFMVNKEALVKALNIQEQGK